MPSLRQSVQLKRYGPCLNMGPAYPKLNAISACNSGSRISLADCGESSSDQISTRQQESQPRAVGFSLQINDLARIDMERAMGIEPTAQAWEAWVLPLYDARSGRLGRILSAVTRPFNRAGHQLSTKQR